MKTLEKVWRFPGISKLYLDHSELLQSLFLPVHVNIHVFYWRNITFEYLALPQTLRDAGTYNTGYELYKPCKI